MRNENVANPAHDASLVAPTLPLPRFMVRQAQGLTTLFAFATGLSEHAAEGVCEVQRLLLRSQAQPGVRKRYLVPVSANGRDREEEGHRPVHSAGHRS